MCIQCSKCNYWAHKTSTVLKTLAVDQKKYKYPRCRNKRGVCPIDVRPSQVGDIVPEAVYHFCYLGDMLSAAGGCDATAIARCKCARGKIHENLSLLTADIYLSRPGGICIPLFFVG